MADFYDTFKLDRDKNLWQNLLEGWKQTLGGGFGLLFGGAAADLGAGISTAQTSRYTSLMDKQQSGELLTGLQTYGAQKAKETIEDHHRYTYRYYTAPGAAAGALAASPNSPYFGDPKRAFYAARYNREAGTGISPGQATTLLLSNVVPGNQAVEAINWNDPRQVREYFQFSNDRWAAIGSGLIDAGANVFLDPWVMSGGVYVKLRSSIVTRPISNPKTRDIVVDQIQRAGRGEQTPAKPFIDLIKNAESKSELLFSKTIYQGVAPEEVVNSLWQARKFGDQAIADTLSVAFGDRAAYERLKSQSSILGKIFDDAQAVDDWAMAQLNTPVSDIVQVPFWTKASLDSWRATQSKVLQEVAEEFDWLNATIKGEAKPTFIAQNLDELAVDGVGIFGTLGKRSFAKWTWASNAQAAADKRRANQYLNTTELKSEAGVPIRVFSWLSEGGPISELPSGYLKVGALSTRNSSREAIAWADEVVRLTGQGSDYKKYLVDGYLSSKDKAQRAAWVKEAESDALTKLIAKELGMDTSSEIAMQNAKEFATLLTEQHAALRSTAMKQYVENNYVIIDSDGVSAISPQLKAALQESGYTKDALQKIPLYSTQYADVVPLMDLKLIQDVVRNNKTLFKDLLENFVDVEDVKVLQTAIKNYSRRAELEDGLSAKGRSAWNKLNSGLDTFYSVWKPVTLLRLAYVTRNLGEGGGRVVVIGNVLANELGGSGLGLYTSVAKNALQGTGLQFANVKNYAKYVAIKNKYKNAPAKLGLVIDKSDAEIKSALSVVAQLEKQIRDFQKTLRITSGAQIRDLRKALSSRLDTADNEIDSFINDLARFADEAGLDIPSGELAEALALKMFNARNQKSVENSIKGIVDDIDSVADDLDKFILLRGQGKTPEQFNAEITALQNEIKRETKIAAKDKIYPGFKAVLEQNPKINAGPEDGVELIKTSFLFKFAKNTEDPKLVQQSEFAGQDIKPLEAFDGVKALSNELKSNQGLKDPIVIGYDKSTGKAVLIDGRISLEAAKDAKISYVPVKVIELDATVVSTVDGEWSRLVAGFQSTGVKPIANSGKPVLPSTIFPKSNLYQVIPETQTLKDLNNLLVLKKADKDRLNPDLMTSRFYQSGISVSNYEVDIMTRLNDALKELSTFYKGIEIAQSRKVKAIDDIANISEELKYTRQYIGSNAREVDGAYYPGPAQGTLGEILMKGEASVEPTVKNFLSKPSIQRAYLNQVERINKWTNVKPEDPTWFDAWLYRVNQHVRKDSVSQQVLAGKTDDEIMIWAKTSAGLEYQKLTETGIKAFGAGNFKQFVQWLRNDVEKTVPAFLRKDILARDAIEADALRIPFNQRSVIPGPELLPDKLSLNRMWDKFTKTVFKYIGSLPEDTLLRFPLYAATYDLEMKRLANLWKLKTEDLTNEAWASFAFNAHSKALKTVKENLFTIERYSQPGQFLRFVSPFYMAQQNSTRFWIGKSIEDPRIPAVGLMLWNTPNRMSGLEVRDANDSYRKVGSSLPFAGRNEQVFITLPDNVAKSLGIPDVNQFRVSKNSALNMVLDSNAPWFPSLGFPVTMPASFLFQQMSGSKFDINASLDELGIFGKQIRKVLLGGNFPSETNLASVAPQNPFIARMYRAFNSNDPIWQNRFNSILKKKTAQSILEGVSLDSKHTADLIKSSAEQTRKSFIIEALFSTTAPATGVLGTDFTLLEGEFRRYVQADPDNGAAQFTEEYGEAIASITAASQSDNRFGILSNSKSFRNFKKWKPFIEDVRQLSAEDPGLIGAMVNTDREKFDPIVYIAQTNEELFQVPLRGRKGALEANDNLQVSAGWAEYIPIAQELDDKVKLGLISKEQAAAGRKAATETLAEQYPLWAAKKNNFDSDGDQQTVDFVYKVLENKAFMKDATRGNDQRAQLWKALEQWSVQRKNVSQYLDKFRNDQSRKTSTDINSESNTQVRVAYEEYIDSLINEYPAFGPFYQRYLRVDKFVPSKYEPGVQ
jgi:hypothetical protein